MGWYGDWKVWGVVEVWDLIAYGVDGMMKRSGVSEGKWNEVVK